MVCICLSHIVAGKMAAPRGLSLFVTYCCRQDGGATWSVFVCYICLKPRWRRHMVCICLSHIVAGKMAASCGLHLFVTYCCGQDGGASWSVFVCHILLQARWRRHVVCICLSHIVSVKMAVPRGLHLFVTYCCRQMAAPRGLYLFVTYCSRQDGGAT
jgi:hypothetical protein